MERRAVRSIPVAFAHYYILALEERTTCLARISHTNDKSPPTMRRRNKFAVTPLTKIPPRVTNDSSRDSGNLPSRDRDRDPTEPERLIVAYGAYGAYGARGAAHSAHSSRSEVESGFAGPRGIRERQRINRGVGPTCSFRDILSFRSRSSLKRGEQSEEKGLPSVPAFSPAGSSFFLPSLSLFLSCFPLFFPILSVSPHLGRGPSTVYDPRPTFSSFSVCTTTIGHHRNHHRRHLPRGSTRQSSSPWRVFALLPRAGLPVYTGPASLACARLVSTFVHLPASASTQSGYLAQPKTRPGLP